VSTKYEEILILEELAEAYFVWKKTEVYK